ncbi:hypothetical protein PROFUN_07993 [Planoprotostelium fungivorum]|uniref:SYO1-like TPR repeats domain-containing protein n=1 Tax=Planoprotostelium fungivorum TaxID=1890364 RepID=A0A2P6MVA0_9EUKA|nr:hypothetical protein PROFUN_07993 [Planoprotostelium fungivorum]
MGGKSKKNDRAQRRQNVEPIPSSAVPSSDRVDPTEKYPVFAQVLQDRDNRNSEENERETACAAASQFAFEDPKIVGKLIDLGLLKCLIERMGDPSISVRTAAAGAIRNFTLGGEEICEKLMQSDCMTPLLHLTLSYKQHLQEAKELDKKVAELLMIQVIASFTNLCETNNRAVELFSNSTALSMALELLNVKQYPLQLVIETAQFLNVVTENNESCCRAIRADRERAGALEVMMKDPEQHIYLRMLLCAIHLNVATVVDGQENNNQEYTPFIMQGVQLDVQTIFSECIQKELNEPAEDEMDGMNRVYHQVQWACKAKQLALELLTNILTGECAHDSESADRREGEEEEGANEMETEEYVEVDINKVDYLFTQLPGTTSSYLKQFNIERSILQQCAPLDTGSIQLLHTFSNKIHHRNEPRDQMKMHVATRWDQQILSPEECTNGMVKSLKMCSLRALSCLGNVLLCMSREEVKNESQVWNHLIRLCDVKTEVARLTSEISCGEVYSSIVDVATSNLYVLLRKILSVSPGSNFWTTEEVESIYKMCQREYSRETRVNCLNIITVITRHPSTPTSFYQVALDLFLASLSDETDIVKAALDGIFDVYAEKEANAFIQLAPFSEALTKTQAQLKAKKKKGGLTREEVEDVDEMMTNLDNFIAYKREQQ